MFNPCEPSCWTFADGQESCTLGLFADGSPSTLEVTSAQVERRVVTWKEQEFAFGQMLQILIPEGSFVSANKNLAMGRSSGEYSFSIREGDVVPPRVIAIEPTERRDGVVQMIFSEAVIFEGDRGRVVPLETSEGRLVHFNATVEGAVVTIHGPFRKGESYQLRQSASALVDIMRNRAVPWKNERQGAREIRAFGAWVRRLAFSVPLQHALHVSSGQSSEAKRRPCSAFVQRKTCLLSPFATCSPRLIWPILRSQAPSQEHCFAALPDRGEAGGSMMCHKLPKLHDLKFQSESALMESMIGS
eukprot:s217_g18.t1